MDAFVPPGYLHFRIDHPATALALNGGGIERVRLTAPSGDNTLRWRFADAGAGMVTICNVDSGRVLEADTEGTVRAVTDDHGAAQRWRIEHAGDGHAKFTNVATGRVLDVDRHTACARASNGAPTQKWGLAIDLAPGYDPRSTFTTCCGHGHVTNKRFNDPRHRSIVETGVSLLKGGGPYEAWAVFEEWWDHEDFRAGIGKGLLDADYEPPYKGDFWDSHFYDPDTGKNYKHKTEGTALTEANRYFYKSLDARTAAAHKGGASMIKTDERHAIGYDLGLALHFLTDLAQPMHAANFTNLSAALTDMRHQGFEDYADSNLEAFHADLAAFRAHAPSLTHDLPGGVIIALAKNSKRVYVEKVLPELRLKQGAGDTWFSMGSGATGTMNVWRSEADPALREALPYGECATASFLALWSTCSVQALINKIHWQVLKRASTTRENERYTSAIVTSGWSVRQIVTDAAASAEYYDKFASKARTMVDFARLVVRDLRARELTSAEESMLKGVSSDVLSQITRENWETAAKSLTAEPEYQQRFGDYRAPDSKYGFPDGHVPGMPIFI